MADFDVIYEVSEPEETVTYTDSSFTITIPDPVLIRGAGNFTVFGLSNKFDTEFPQALSAKTVYQPWGPHGYGDGAERIGAGLERGRRLWIVKDSQKESGVSSVTEGVKGSGASWQTQHLIEKVLDWENSHLYHKLGLHWRLAKQRSDTNSMTEYVLLLEFIPKIPIHRPD